VSKIRSKILAAHIVLPLSRMFEWHTLFHSTRKSVSVACRLHAKLLHVFSVIVRYTVSQK